MVNADDNCVFVLTWFEVANNANGTGTHWEKHEQVFMTKGEVIAAKRAVGGTYRRKNVAED